MKKILLTLLIVMFGIIFISCDDTPIDNPTDNENEITFNDVTTVEQIKEVAISEYDKVYTSEVSNLSDEEKSIAEIKYNEIKTKLASLEGSAEEIKKQANALYQEFNKTLEVLKEETSKTVSTLDEIKDQALEQLKLVYDSLQAVASETTMEYIDSLYNEAVQEIKATTEETKDEIKSIVSDFIKDTKDYAKEVIDEELAKLIESARVELKKAYVAIDAKIDNEDIKAKVKALYEKTDLQIAGITDKEKASAEFSEYIKEFSSEAVEILKEAGTLTLEKYKTMALDYLDDLYNEYIGKITDADIKAIAGEFYTELTQTINDSVTIEQIETLYNSLKEKITSYAKNELVQKAIEKYTTEIKEMVDNLIKDFKDDDLVKEINTLVNAELDKIKEATNLDELKIKVQEAKDELTANVKKAIANYAASKLDDLKVAAKKSIEDLAASIISKTTDETIIKEVNDAKDDAVSEIDEITDADSFQTAVEKIKTEFLSATKVVLNQIISKYVEAAKKEAKEVYEPIVKELSEKSQAAFKKMYDELMEDLDAIEDYENAEKEIKEALTKFTESAKTYIKEIIAEEKEKAIQTINEKYNEKIAELKSNEYVIKFNKLKDDVIAKINGLEDYETIAEDAADIIVDFGKDIVNLYADYYADLAKQAKEDTLEKGKTLYDGYENTEEYKNLSKIKQGIAKTAIEVAYAAFTKAIDKIPETVGAEALCETAYNTFVKAYNKALGIEEDK